MDTSKVLITKDYIMSNRTSRGSWTRAQIQALGLKWPPVAGWITEAVGTHITPEQARAFESKQYAKKSSKNINQIKNSISNLKRKDIVHLQSFINEILRNG